jgi:hypothetical protein
VGRRRITSARQTHPMGLGRRNPLSVKPRQ